MGTEAYELIAQLMTGWSDKSQGSWLSLFDLKQEAQMV